MVYSKEEQRRIEIRGIYDRNVQDVVNSSWTNSSIFHEENGEVCPANWKPGKEGMKDTHEGVADYLSKH